MAECWEEERNLPWTCTSSATKQQREIRMAMQPSTRSHHLSMLPLLRHRRKTGGMQANEAASRWCFSVFSILGGSMYLPT
ncbi:hypothetical protein GE21DRAFT_1287020 [Neurospora crassa]|nr:hypothetical protein GE21DRAFT_1287020 [Neurospora crassa]